MSNSIDRILKNFVDHELFIRWSKKLGDMSPMSPRNYGPVMSSFCEHKSVPLAVVLSLTTDQGYFLCWQSARNSRSQIAHAQFVLRCPVLKIFLGVARVLSDIFLHP